MMKEMKKGDWILIGLVLLISIVIVVSFYLPKEETQSSMVQIYQNGERIQEFPLNKDVVFTVVGDFTNVISIENGKVSVITSDCPGNDCVKMGWLTEGKQSIVCLPNKMEIRLAGESEVDFVVQ